MPDDQPTTASPITDQPPPTPNDRPAIQDLVIADMHDRKAIGLKRYGVALQTFNGREALVDAYQETLDLAQYLRQEIEERTLFDAVVSAAMDWRARQGGSRPGSAPTTMAPTTMALVAAVDALTAAGGSQ